MTSKAFSKPKKVVIAMSGGVDSSVAAALLKQQGYEVIGITMQIWEPKSDFGGCCSISAINDARSVAQKLGIPHYVLNFRKEFESLVINNFIEEYKNGRTPNPCIRCNQFIKFDLLIKKAKKLGADYIATGHYARIVKTQGSIFKLLIGKDPLKDQSYVLYSMNQESLSYTLFPLGELTKKEVRKIAKELDLSVSEKQESQEICFVENNDYGSFIEKRFPKYFKPGFIFDMKSNVVGKHKGILYYTIGQRKGIGAHKNKKYVVKIDVKNNALIIGEDKDLLRNSLVAEDINFISGKSHKKCIEICAKIRYNSPAVDAKLTFMCNSNANIEFKHPQRAVTPGQSVVFYYMDEVLGGGIIK